MNKQDKGSCENFWVQVADFVEGLIEPVWLLSAESCPREPGRGETVGCTGPL